jgi:branched-subunit amino acid aminotransferase/4-amino-4-deoxychorismate lyase
MDPTIKTRSRMHWRIGDRLVKREHPGASAVFADAAGNLTETSSANLFVLKEGEVLTPPSGRVLNGISRQVVTELAQAAGYNVKEHMISLELALKANEIWMSSTPYCMLPVTRFNETTISGGQPGPVFQQILDAWSDLVGVDIREQIMKNDSVSGLLD